MKKVDFNDYAASFSSILQEQLHFFGESEEYFAEYKVKVVTQHVKRIPNTILEYGCGTGRNLKYLLKYFPASQVFGCDISENSLEFATRLNPKAHLFLLGKNAPRQKFDLIFVANVFHHIERNLRLNSILEIAASLADPGEIFFFEHNPYNPITRHLVKICPFDADAVLLKPKELRQLLVTAGLKVSITRNTFFFPRFLKYLRFLEKGLGHLPVGGQYFIHALKE